MRARLALVLAAAFVVAPLAPVLAQSAGPLRVLVADTAGRAVHGAEVVERLGGSDTAVGQTGTDGTLLITPHDRADLFARFGGRISPRVPARGESITLVVPLAVIGSIAARRTDTPALVTESSAAALVSGDVASSLGLVPNYRSAAEGGSGRQTLNGVPLELPTGPRGTGQDGGIPADLVESFTAAQADDGSVAPNYHVLAPSAAQRTKLAFGATQWDGSLWKLSTSGTSGRLGYALVAAGGGDGGVLAHDVFGDASGLRYDHSSNARHLDGSVSLAYAIGSTQINAVAIGSRKRNADVSATMPGDIAAGFGPGDETRSSSLFGYVVATQAHGRDSYHLLHAFFAGGMTDDASNAVFDGAAIGSVSGYRYTGSYDEAALTRKLGSGSLTAKATALRVRTDAFSEYLGQTFGGGAQASQHGFSLGYESGNGPRGFGTTVSTFARSGAFAGSGVEANVHVRGTIAGAQVRLAATHAQAQTQQAYSVGAYQLSAPTAATVTCDPGSATVGAPAQLDGKHPQTDTLTGRVEKRFANGARIDAGGFLSSGRNMFVPATVGGLALPPGYASALGRDFAALCPGRHLASNEIFAQRYESVPHLTGREWYVAAVVPVGALRAEISYETYSLFAPVVPASAGVTTLAPFKQIDGVPLHRANLVLSRTRGSTMIAGALQYVSDNNAAHLPGHVSLSVGAQVPFGHGALALSVQNALGAYAGTFVSPRFAQPLGTSAGAIPTLATPNRRTWTLRYTLPLTAPR